MGEFESWLYRSMESKGVRSIGRLARETGLEALRVGDWATGRRLPEEADEYVKLGAYFGVSPTEVLSHAQVAAPRW
jgi:hypothetical protein